MFSVYLFNMKKIAIQKRICKKGNGNVCPGEARDYEKKIKK